MHLRSCLILFGLLVIASLPVHAVDLVADLAAYGPGNHAFPAPVDQPLEVKIVNRAPGNDYEVSVVIRQIPIQPLDVGALSVGAGDPSSSSSDCPDLVNLKQKLRVATDEDDVPSLVSRLEAEIDQAPASCSGDAADARSVIAATTTGAGSYTLRSGEELVLTVTRKEKAGKVKKATWIFTWSTGPRGEWRASYGFGFFSDDEREYFTAPGDEEVGEQKGKFIIREEADRGEKTFAPAVFFTWNRAVKRYPEWDYGLGAGLGFDLSSPVVFLGGQLTYNENFTLHLGCVFRPETRLHGRYEVDDIVGESLGDDQLHETTYDGQPFLGVSLRFGKNPFKKGGGS